jgi:hypothetical protein
MEIGKKFLERYKGRRVMIQLSKEHAMFAVTFGGNRIVRGEEHAFLAPAVMESEGQKQLVGYADVIPDGEIVDCYGDPSDPREAIIVRVNDASGAELEIDIPTESVEYIVMISRPPSRIVA